MRSLGGDGAIVASQDTLATHQAPYVRQLLHQGSIWSTARPTESMKLERRMSFWGRDVERVVVACPNTVAGWMVELISNRGGHRKRQLHLVSARRSRVGTSVDGWGASTKGKSSKKNDRRRSKQERWIGGGELKGNNSLVLSCLSRKIGGGEMGFHG